VPKNGIHSRKGAKIAKKFRDLQSRQTHQPGEAVASGNLLILLGVLCGFA
jgi:phosphotransferase system HPr-like phosphotransfer protein